MVLDDFENASEVSKISLNTVINELDMETVHLSQDPECIYISSTKINRPGLHLIGFFDYFDVTRIQIMGKAEFGYLDKLKEEERNTSLRNFFAYGPPVIVVTRNIPLSDKFIEIAKEHKVSVIRTKLDTSSFLSNIISLLNMELAPTITRHGGLMEVYGEGVLILGESGIGKSETAIELIKRGHRLVADDAVEIKRISHKMLVGSAPENIRHFLEIRGVGIINARQIFGLSSVKIRTSIDLVIKLEQWDHNKVYDRIGLERDYQNILGLQVPAVTIPIKPGRSISILIEVAAINHRQNKMGYSAPEELFKNLGYENWEDDF